MSYIVLIILGIILSIFVPLGGVLLISITFAVVIMNYQKTIKINQDIQEIRKHFGLLKGHEKEEYEIEEQLNELDALDDPSLDEINKQIEEELEESLKTVEKKNLDKN